MGDGELGRSGTTVSEVGHGRDGCCGGDRRARVEQRVTALGSRLPA